MRGGFMLLELLFALFLLSVGVLATAGMLFLAQENFRRAELTLRGITELGWIEDSVAAGGGAGGGQVQFKWGDVAWAPSTVFPGGWDMAAVAPAKGDTVLILPGLPDQLARPLTDMCGVAGPVRVRTP
jgi:hypothetical protein